MLKKTIEQNSCHNEWQNGSQHPGTCRIATEMTQDNSPASRYGNQSASQK